MRGVVTSAVPGLGLSPKGEQQADRVAGALRGSIDIVYASPALRATSTAQRIAARSEVPIVIDSRLTEIDVGAAEGMGVVEGLRILDIGWDKWIQDGKLDEQLAPGGERAIDALDRFRDFLADAEAKFEHLEDATIAVVSHGGLLQLSIPLLSKNLSNAHGRTQWLRNTQTVIAHRVPGGLWCDKWAGRPIMSHNSVNLPNEQTLTGGGSTVVTRIGQTVRRPVRPWTPSVHGLLRHLQSVGFYGAPKVHGIDDCQREILDYLPGTVGNYPWSNEVRSETALLSSARLLRDYHEATVPIADTQDAGWMFPAMEPREVICHSDFAPYNCVFEGERAVGIIDFDTARPGPRAWDLAYALYRFAPFAGPGNKDGEGSGDICVQAVRARAFLEAYGASQALRADSVAMLVPRLQALIDFMRESADRGNEQFQRHIEEGHMDLYQDDIAYMEANMSSIVSIVVNGDDAGFNLSSKAD